jgi:hypothetical protein
MKQDAWQNDFKKFFAIVRTTAVLLAADALRILVEKPMNFFEVLEQMSNTADKCLFYL